MHAPSGALPLLLLRMAIAAPRLHGGQSLQETRSVCLRREPEAEAGPQQYHDPWQHGVYRLQLRKLSLELMMMVMVMMMMMMMMMMMTMTMTMTMTTTKA